MRINRYIKRLLYNIKNAKPTDKNIFRLLIPSFIGIVVCMFCLSGATWAWFTASVTTPAQTIQAAGYNVEVSIVDAAPNSNGTYTLAENVEYTVILTAAGSASAGYVVVESGGAAPMYTEPLKAGDSLVFTLIPATTETYTFTGAWGTYSGEADIKDGDSVGG